MKSTFNNLISIEYPDDFKELSEEENQKYFTGDLLRLSFQNIEKHFLLSVSKSKNSLINRFISPATVIGGSLSNLENNLKEFQHVEEYESTIFDKPSITECFSYLANNENVKQYGELSVFKVGSAFYIVYCISRFEDKEESKQIFKLFKESFKSVEQ